GHRLVHGVVQHLGEQVVQGAFVGAADIHAGAFADGLQPLQHPDGGGGITGGGGGGRAGVTGQLDLGLVRGNGGGDRRSDGRDGFRRGRLGRNLGRGRFRDVIEQGRSCGVGHDDTVRRFGGSSGRPR